MTATLDFVRGNRTQFWKRQSKEYRSQDQSNLTQWQSSLEPMSQKENSNLPNYICNCVNRKGNHILLL